MQGRALSGLLFALVIHPELKALNAELEPFGGCGKAYMDDTYIAAPPREAFAAARRFATRIKKMADLDIQWAKVACWSPKQDQDMSYLRDCIWRDDVPLGFITDDQGNQGYGIDVLGVPIGDNDYIGISMQCKAKEVVSYIEKTVDTFHLQLLSRHALWATLYYCCQSRFDYFLRHLRPEHTRPGCTIIQVALTKAVETLGYDNMIIGDDITTRRLHLPIRQGGCGIRNLYKLAVAAYSSSFIEAAITFTTSEIVMHGTFKGLADVFPAAGFQPGGSRFQRALGLGNLPSMQSCADAWDEMRLEVNQPAVGPLSQTILNAGHGMGSRFLQRQLTRQRTDVERASLHHDIMQLPSTDTRRMAWLSRDKISSAGLTSWPTKKCAMDDTTFSEMLTQFLGRESFMVRHLAGKYIPCSLNQHTTCCKFGFELSAATLPVATFNDPHDEASQALYMGLMSTVTTVRVEPAHLFSGIVPPDLMVPTEYKKQPAIVPDAAVTVSIPAAQTARHARQSETAQPLRMQLFDTKIIHAFNAYQHGQREREDQGGAVAARARKVETEYKAHARKMDARIATAQNAPLATAVQTHLQTLGPIRAAVLGHFGECSPDIHHLVRAAAESLAATRWRAMGARSESEARGFFMNAVRKELSMSFWTALARHRQNRLDFVGISRADVQRMRDQNQRGFGMGGRVRGRHGPVVAPGPRVAPPGWARPSDLRAFAAYQAPGVGVGA